jgi:ATP-dependent Clp protease ATP-binding subunit ClpC
VPERRNGLAVVGVFARAASEARRMGAPAVEPAHILLALCELAIMTIDVFLVPPGAQIGESEMDMIAAQATMQTACLAAGFHAGPFCNQLRGQLERQATAAARPVREGPIHRSPRCRRLFERADSLAPPHARVEPVDLLQATLEVDPSWRKLDGSRPLPALVASLRAQRPGSVTPMLDQFGRDLSAEARLGKLPQIIGRQDEIRRIARVLVQAQPVNPLLVGGAGVGKTGVVEGLAARLAAGTRSGDLADLRIIELRRVAVVAGAGDGPTLWARLQALVEEANTKSKVLLFIDEIDSVLGDLQGPMDPSLVLRPAIAGGQLRCIGTTTEAGLRHTIERNPALKYRFHRVDIDELSPADVITVVSTAKARLERRHGVTIDPDAVRAAVELTSHYMPDTRLPGKAVQILDQAGAAAQLASLSPRTPDAVLPPPPVIGRSEVTAMVADLSGLSVERLANDQARRSLHLEAELSQRVIGQETAVRAVSEAIRAAQAGLRNPNRPIGSFLFVGQTGTGKTELARALTDVLFSDPARLVRIDMSEYYEAHTVSRLVGSPPGYVGHEEEGQLTGPVRANPESVVLLDEIEKAHPEVLNLLLQVLDAAQLTDSRGNRVSFAQAVVILTSNIGVGQPGLTRALGFGDHQVEQWSVDAQERLIREAVARTLKPELLNRLDRIIVFRPLDRAAIRAILDQEIAAVEGRLRARNIRVELDAAVYDVLMVEGFNPAFGARELHRAVERLLTQPLATAILEGAVRDGSLVRVEACDGRLRLVEAG